MQRIYAEPKNKMARPLDLLSRLVKLLRSNVTHGVGRDFVSDIVASVLVWPMEVHPGVFISHVALTREVTCTPHIVWYCWESMS